METEARPAARRRDSPAWRLFHAIVRARGDGARMLCEHFLELPSRSSFPGYYAVIEKPVCVGDIATRLLEADLARSAGVGTDGGLYGFRDARKEVRRMILNAKKFNAPDCEVYKDALALEVWRACCPCTRRDTLAAVLLTFKFLGRVHRECASLSGGVACAGGEYAACTEGSPRSDRGGRRGDGFGRGVQVRNPASMLRPAVAATAQPMLPFRPRVRMLLQ
jgi:hypothetical protein